MAAPTEAAPMLGDCLRLLSDSSDENWLAGLLLAAEFCRGRDKESIIKIHNSVGTVFLDRLLKTGVMTDKDSIMGNEDRDAYLRLSVTILAAFFRVPEIASSWDMISKIPVMLEFISKTSNPSNIDLYHEFLLSITLSSRGGLRRAVESGIINVLAGSISNSLEGSLSLELAVRILQYILNAMNLGVIIQERPEDMSRMVVAIAKRFAMSHSALKFEMFHLLTRILSSNYAVQMSDLRFWSNEIWPSYIRHGVISILQSRIVSEEKLQALSLVDFMMYLLHEWWLLECKNLPGALNHLSMDEGLLLVLESARAEAAVVLRDLARVKYVESGDPYSSKRALASGQHNLDSLFSLLEKVIKLIHDDCDGERPPIAKATITKALDGIDETIHLVLDFLANAKDHAESKGDDLLACVQLLGSYLAEVPFACEENVSDLLQYILSVEGKHELRPFFSICFMLPMLSRTTVDEKGCDILVSCGGHESIVSFLVGVSTGYEPAAGGFGAAFLACDAIKNLLLIRNNSEKCCLEMPLLMQLFQALTVWTENRNDSSAFLSSACVIVLALDCTSEDDILEAIKSFDQHLLGKLSRLLARGLDLSRLVDGSLADKRTQEFCRIIVARYPCSIERFPNIWKAAER